MIGRRGTPTAAVAVAVILLTLTLAMSPAAGRIEVVRHQHPPCKKNSRAGAHMTTAQA